MFLVAMKPSLQISIYQRPIKPAVIVMAHGFAGLRQFKLVQYAQRLPRRAMQLFI